jgi:hypothetical protein
MTPEYAARWLDQMESLARAALIGSIFHLPVGIAPMTLQRAADPDG